MSIPRGLLTICVIAICLCSTIHCQQQIPLKRGQTTQFPNFSENSIRTGFVDTLLLYGYNTTADHPCDRVCTSDAPYICYYQLVLEEYESYNEQACSANCLNFPLYYTCPGCIQTDGVKTRLLSINRQIPGPPINVCTNDLVIADIINRQSEATSIHWHGIDQSQTPYMDGMPFITQAEIPPGKIFRYKFVASNHGTNFYHSHSRWQRGQGIYGALTVRLKPMSNPHWKEYDVDNKAHSMIIADWGYNLNRSPDNLLINGKGWSLSQGAYRGAPGVYFVRPQYRYRFRLVFNGVNNLPVEFSIDGHQLLVISADGNEVKPIEVKSIILNTGERFDFVLFANQPVGNYWIKVCNPLNRTLSQVAILRYEGVNVEYPPIAPDFRQRPSGLQVNTINVGPGTPGTVTVSELLGLNEVPWLGETTWQTSYLQIGINRKVLNFEINKISMTMPPVPLLIEKDRINDRVYCNTSTLLRQGIDCSQTTCKCTQVLQFELNTYVEIIIFSDGLHPAHLHGYLFFIVGMGVITSQPISRELIIDMDRRGELRRNTYFPILKDTVGIPTNGYVIIQFLAFNPGYWFMHCHIDQHAIQGMSAVIQVGQPNQMVAQPIGYQAYPT